MAIRYHTDASFAKAIGAYAEIVQEVPYGKSLEEGGHRQIPQSLISYFNLSEGTKLTQIINGTLTNSDKKIVGRALGLEGKRETEEILQSFENLNSYISILDDIGKAMGDLLVDFFPNKNITVDQARDGFAESKKVQQGGEVVNFVVNELKILTEKDGKPSTNVATVVEKINNSSFFTGKQQEYAIALANHYNTQLVNKKITAANFYALYQEHKDMEFTVQKIIEEIQTIALKLDKETGVAANVQKLKDRLDQFKNNVLKNYYGTKSTKSTISAGKQRGFVAEFIWGLSMAAIPALVNFEASIINSIDKEVLESAKSLSKSRSKVSMGDDSRVAGSRAGGFRDLVIFWDKYDFEGFQIDDPYRVRSFKKGGTALVDSRAAIAGTVTVNGTDTGFEVDFAFSTKSSFRQEYLQTKKHKKQHPNMILQGDDRYLFADLKALSTTFRYLLDPITNVVDFDKYGNVKKAGDWQFLASMYRVLAQTEISTEKSPAKFHQQLILDKYLNYALFGVDDDSIGDFIINGRIYSTSYILGQIAKSETKMVQLTRTYSLSKGNFVSAETALKKWVSEDTIKNYNNAKYGIHLVKIPLAMPEHGITY